MCLGRCSFTRRLKGRASRIHFDTAGGAYLTVIEGLATVYSAADNSVQCDVVHKQRVNQAVFLDNPEALGGLRYRELGRVLTVGDDRLLKIHSFTGLQV
jgi:hypothetical protein